MERPDGPSIERALRAVLSAFPEDVRPPEEISTGGRWFDEKGELHTYQNSEADEVARFFGGRSWTAIAAGELLNWSHASVATIFLTPAAHAYYLPALLRAVLTAPGESDWGTFLEFTAQRWTPPDALRQWAPTDNRTTAQRNAMNTARADSFQRFVDALTPPQKSALALFMEVFEPLFDDPDIENPITTALDALWRRYCPR